MLYPLFLARARFSAKHTNASQPTATAQPGLVIMLHRLKRHPIPITAWFEHSLVLIGYRGSWGSCFGPCACTSNGSFTAANCGAAILSVPSCLPFRAHASIVPKGNRIDRKHHRCGD